MYKNVLFILVLLSAVSSVFATPVSDYGQLQIKNGKLCDKSGSVVQLRGMSMFWNNYDDETFWTPAVVKNLAIDWNVNVIRLAMGAEDKPGDGSKYYYTGDRDKDEVSILVDAAIEAGIYVIIDWHGHYANNHLSEAKEFFSYMSEKYGDSPNVIYEVWNEPIISNWSTIKQYGESVLAQIRKNDPDNIVIMGTGFYCQEPAKVIGNTIDDDNVMYAIHVYAASHDGLYSGFNSAVSAKLPLFMSEWGTCDASGAGSFSKSQSDSWISWMDNNDVSWCNWSIYNKEEAASALMPDASLDGKWGNDELTESGEYILNIIKSSNRKYTDNGTLEIINAKYTADKIYVWLNKPLKSISSSDFSISGYSIKSVELRGSVGEEIAISVDKAISGTISLVLDVEDAFGVSSINKEVEVTPHETSMPLKINIGGNQSYSVSSLGYVAEQEYEEGRTGWGTTWYSSNGGTDRTTSGSDFYGDGELDEVMGVYMYGLSNIDVAVKNGKYVAAIAGFEDVTRGPSAELIFGLHAFNVYAEGEMVVEDFDSYKNNGETSKASVCLFEVDVTDGVLNLELESVYGDFPMVSAVVIGDEDFVWDKGPLASTAVADVTVASELSLELYPNPFNPVVNVNFSLPKATSIQMKVYDIKGRVMMERNIKDQSSGIFGLNMSNFSSGVYMIRLTSANYVITKKAILLK